MSAMSQQTNQDLDHSQSIDPERPFAVIDGVLIELPPEARFYMQDKRGSWFYSIRKPRPKFNDWTKFKTPIQPRNEKGGFIPRVVQSPKAEDWENTVCRVFFPTIAK